MCYHSKLLLALLLFTTIIVFANGAENIACAGEEGCCSPQNRYFLKLIFEFIINGRILIIFK